MVWFEAKINLFSLLGCGPQAEHFYKPGLKWAGEMECILLWRMSFIQARTYTTPSSIKIQRVYLYPSDLANPIFNKGPDIICWHLAFLINRSTPSSNFFHRYLKN